jgi:dihydropyrimidinase
VSSADFDLVITGSTIVTPQGLVEGDLAIRGETIAAIGDDLGARAARAISAAGKVVLPGVIDAHVHCRTWTDHSDEIADSHRSAAFGGVTTAITQIRAAADMAPGDAIRHFIDEGSRTSVIDFGLHTILRPEHDIESAIPDVVGLGSPSVKFFMAYKDTGIMSSDVRLLRGFELARDNGALTMVHAEDGELIAKLIGDARAARRVAIEDFAPAEPASSEDLGTIKALVYAAALGTPLYILHMTTAGAVRALREAQAAGQRVWGESCPKYLTLTNDDLIAKGPLAKVGPPLRTRADNEALWSAIADGAVSVIASDHAPRDRASLTETKDIFEEPYGAPGTETMLPVIYDEMIVRRGRPLEELAAVLSSNPAKIYGLYPRKGALQVGADADIVILDPTRPMTIRASEQHTTATYSLYEGRRVAASVTHSFVRGRPLLADGELAQQPGYGKFLFRRPEDLMQLAPGRQTE